jgi:L-iditol 2-dehydrogenase
MKAAYFKQIGELEIRDIPVPEPGEGEVLIKVDYCSICGSDIHGFTKGLWAYPGTPMGHEFAGVVEKVGPNPPEGVEIGQRVTAMLLTSCGVCDACFKGFPNLCTRLRGGGGGFANYFKTVKRGTLKMIYPLPDNISTLEASMMEPLATALHGVKQAWFDLNDTVAIFGAGTIGLLVAQIVKAYGVVKVIQIDLSKKRLDCAKELGVDYVINAAEVDDVLAEIEKIVGPKVNNYGHSGYCDVVFECAGSPKAIEQAQKAVKGGGQIISIALTETDDVKIDIPALVQKEVTWKGSYAYVSKFHI